MIKEHNQNIHIGEIQLDEEHQTYGVEIRRQNYKLNLDTKFLTSPEFRELENLFQIVRDLGDAPYTVRQKTESKR